ASYEGDGYTRTVALKLIRKGLDTERVLERFRLERRILAGLRHPNIASLLDGGATEDGRPFFVMEFVEGEPVDEHCSRRSLPVRERLELVETICDAVQHAHQNLVVHRDIKPQNIMVTPEGHPKLLDFGIGKVLSPEAGGELTLVDDRALTPAYAAPEILRGDAITTAADVYGLGVLLYRLLTGVLPYPAGGSIAERLGALEEPPRRPGSVAPTGQKISRELDAVVLKALAPRPEDRYGSAAALAEDLRRFREGRPVRARTPGVLYSTWKFVGRHRVSVGAAAVVVLSLAAGAWYTVEQSRRVAAERDKALEVRGFLLETFGAAGADRALGDSVTARALLDAQAAVVREAYAARPDLQREMMLVLAEGYERLGLFTEAREWAEEAVALDGPAAPGERASAMGLLGWITHQQGRPDEALPILQDAVADAREGWEAERTLARTLNDLGVVQEALGQFDAAGESHREAMELRVALFGENHRSVAVSASNLSVIRYRQGDFQGAVEEASRALRAIRASFGPDHQRAVIVQSNLAVFKLVAGDLRGAEDDFRDLWQRQARIQGPEHPVTV
ncbi:MAG TPA: serine/threonine-protein kinase, partial [Longimicrobiales bacterium]|nr:serine/threonine-protein kinase [Longimicrobiales bacterium]